MYLWVLPLHGVGALVIIVFCFPMIVGVIANDGTLLMLYIKPDI